ncbi:aminotransferase class V-fold PLP-dependent enzyme [Ferrimonas balearica]|uniref:aminotransferase class V-fold PLP-dependent enzyme n=1 Tax=Ferrimonas balearica TaxID=44012 RepID=UPI001C95C1D5|nr:aminotransferase class V-fold PLP-dependent enzyme [Ferrimonas balearica]MBY5979424.1 aminotransferase class V-fold PLP-dependent enzyme [Ferrimonas balearica]
MMKIPSDHEGEATVSLYLDHAATSFPKPESVLRAVIHYQQRIGSNPSRGAYPEARNAGRIQFDTRAALAELLGVSNPTRLLLGPSATWALNQAIIGVLKPGDHVIVSGLEHNSTMRPLQALKDDGVITFCKAHCDRFGQMDPEQLEALLQPRTRALVFNHGSNVLGTLAPASALAQFARRHGLISICDASQSVGNVPLGLDALGLDLVGFSGHKALQGPMGTGVLYVHPEFDITTMRPLMYGGTGSHSASLHQPEHLPDRFESGTPNMPGIAGLGAAAHWLSQTGINTLAAHKRALVARFYRLGAQVPGLITYVPPEHIHTGTVSFNLAGVSPSALADWLSERRGIALRVGLHCAPLAHQSLGTFPEGTVRFSVGPTTTPAAIDLLVRALKDYG